MADKEKAKENANGQKKKDPAIKLIEKEIKKSKCIIRAKIARFNCRFLVILGR